MRSGLRKWLPVVFILPLMASAAVAGEQEALSQDEIQQQLAGFYFAAARAGDNAVLHEFINAGFDLETADKKGYTALILAAYNGRGDTVRLLLDAGANACTEDKRGNTALLGAIFKGELRIARQLMKADCDLNQPNLAGQTPAMFAALFQRLELLDELAQQGADLHATDMMGNSAARLAEGEFASDYAPAASSSSALPPSAMNLFLVPRPLWDKRSAEQPQAGPKGEQKKVGILGNLMVLSRISEMALRKSTMNPLKALCAGSLSRDCGWCCWGRRPV